MSETTVSVPMDDQALFSGALANEAPAEAAPATTEAPVAEAQPEQQPEETGQPRDEHGRFAPKAEATAEAPAEAAQPEQQQPKDNAGQIPAWRVSEIAEAKRAAEARAIENERRATQLEIQTRQLTEQLRKFTEKPQDPIDPYVDPEKFRDAGVRQAIDPISQQVNGMREFFSQQFAVQQFGQDTVTTAYNELGQAMQRGNRDALTTFERMQKSMHPFGDLVAWHKREKALSTVGDDPNAWFEKEFQRRMAEDPQFAAKLKTPQAQNGSPQAQPIVKLPPSLSRVSSAAESASLSMDDASLFANALK